jgi:hypothetical protein
VIPTLFFSLIESLFILPRHLSNLRKVDNIEDGTGFVGGWRRFQHRFVTRMDQFILRIYKPTLRWCLDWRYLTMAISVAAFAITMGVVAGGHIRFTFFPPVEGDNIAATVTLPLGSTTEETKRVVKKLEIAAEKVRAQLDAETPEGYPSIVRHTLSSVGSQPFKTDQNRSSGRAVASIKSANTGEVHIEASPSEERMFDSHEVARRWREIVGEMPEVEELQFTADIFQAGDAINVVITGADFGQLQNAAEWLKQRLGEFDGVIDIADSFREGKEDNAPRLPDGDGCGDVFLKKQLLHRALLRLMEKEDFFELTVEREKPLCRRHSGRGKKDAVGRGFEGVVFFQTNQPVAGGRRAGVNAQDEGHASASTAASASSVIFRLEYTFCTSSRSSRCSMTFITCSVS